MKTERTGYWRNGLLMMGFFLTACTGKDHLFEKADPASSGIEFENKLNPTDDFNIIDYLYFYNGGGVAVGDINNDGLPDIYLSGNQVKNKLYLNKGNLQFEDITEKAGVAGNSTWNTGAVMADVNGDGFLDIYVCAVVGLKNLNGHNELFINNGDNTFTEESAKYGLDFESYCSSAAFLDYDLDGDLDMYILNHAVHTAKSFGHADLRKVRTYETGGKLLRNDSGKFVDVSDEAGIFGGINGYGLGVAISDFNLDGYPDIFVGNDFHEDDYYYLNNRNGTFSEQGKTAFTMMSKFSMGNDAADINHDGRPDLLTLDMLPEDENVLKRSVDDENISIMKIRTGKYGYHYQFPRNMMQINLGNGQFAETALVSNVAATDWSWSALFSDWDQDGNQDIFISNGIPRRPNDLDYIKYVSSDQVVNTIGTTKLVDQKALTMMPSGHARNYIFKGSGGLAFEDKSDEWIPNEKTCSTASAYGDLDNDGDLDLVINNVDGPSALYINQTNQSANYLKIRLAYSKQNKAGIGSKVYSYHAGILQMKELYTVRGFQASSEPLVHFGYGKQDHADSIRVVWPDGRVTMLKNVKLNQTILVSDQDAVSKPASASVDRTSVVFEAVDPATLGIDFTHKEDSYTDFDRLKLLPYQQSDKGPATAVGDIDGDGRDDIFFGGSKYISSQFYFQKEGRFDRSSVDIVRKDSIKEDVEAIIADFNGDGKGDLLIGTGGADFYGPSKPLLDSYYASGPNGLSSGEIDGYFENASSIKFFDFDKDGDPDVFIGNESVSNEFGSQPRSTLLRNDKGVLSPIQPDLFDHLGMVTDAVFDDYNGDGWTDLIVVGEWMQPLFLKNANGTFKKDDAVSGKLGGLWQSVSAFDIDGDGDSDYILGNWGLNSRFKASQAYPMRMYYADFDRNGKAETVIAIAKNGKYYPLDGFDFLVGQIPVLRKKYNTYEAFAGKTIKEVFSDVDLDEVTRYDVQELASGFLRNENGKFAFVPFPLSQQLAPILSQLLYDFDGDGKDEVMLAGNYFGVQPFHGRFASYPGALVKSEGNLVDGISAGLALVNHSVRHLNVITIKNEKFLLVTMNNEKVQLYKLRAR